jgi:hypothetical protein
MKIKLRLFTILLAGGLFFSCSSEESPGDKPETPTASEPSPITITTLSSELLITGENLEITGNNFVNKDYPTKIFINETEATPKEITNTRILLSSLDVKAGVNIVRIQIQDVNSSPLNLFVLAKGWNKLTTLGDVDIANSSVFDDSKTIFSFVNWNTPVKLEPKYSGYLQTPMNLGADFRAFKMFDEKKGVLTTQTQVYFSNDSFKTSNKITIDNNFNPFAAIMRIGYLDTKSSIIHIQYGAQIYTEDNGATIVKNEAPNFAKALQRFTVYGFGKSTSNNKFYQLGKIYDQLKYGNIYKNVVMESETGYSNWIVKDSISNGNFNKSVYKFLNINKILSANYYDKTLLISTDMTKTWTVLKTDVTNVFLRTETQWYIQSGDKLFVTTDSGQTWNLELELPVGSIVNDISFSKSKIIVSGNKGLHYLKIE